MKTHATKTKAPLVIREGERPGSAAVAPSRREAADPDRGRDWSLPSHLDGSQLDVHSLYVESTGAAKGANTVTLPDSPEIQDSLHILSVTRVFRSASEGKVTSLCARSWPPPG